MSYVFEALKTHYDRHNEIIQPEVFMKIFRDTPQREILNGIIKFDAYLDQKRKGAVL